MPGKGMEAPGPFLHTLPCAALPSGCSSLSFIISFNKLVNVKKEERKGGREGGKEGKKGRHSHCSPTPSSITELKAFSWLFY